MFLLPNHTSWDLSDFECFFFQTTSWDLSDFECFDLHCERARTLDSGFRIFIYSGERDRYVSEQEKERFKLKQIYNVRILKSHRNHR